MKGRTKYLFWIIVFYILLQFTWWEVLLVKQTADIIELKKSLVALEGKDLTSLNKEILALENKKMLRIYMMVGEGTVFLIFISIGIARVFKTFKKENELLVNQKNFLLAITHELKTPLASIKLNLQTLLKRQDIPEEKKQQILSNSITDTDRLNQLVEKVLLSAQLDSGNALVNLQKSNLSEHLNQTIQTHLGNFRDRLKLNIESDIYSSFDSFMLASVWINLIENALKYSVNEIVEIHLNAKGENAELRIIDTGPGISDNEKSKVFEMFYRVGDEGKRNFKGTGLGLYIAMKIIEMHKGTIIIESNIPKGSVFKVVLPLFN